VSTEGMSYKEKQAYAKSLKINSFGMKEDELDAAIAEAEAKGVVPEEKPVTPKAKAKDAPPAIDQATLIAMRAAEMAKEALEKLSAVQQPKKSETPDAVIDVQHKTDKAIIEQSEKVPVFIPGGYVGAPKYISVCVNGCLKVIPTGKEVMRPKPIAEVVKRSFELKKKNMERNAKLEKAAIEAGI
jgi:hypothetical protein